jgi:glycerol uptake facilitator-like aquaporin
MDDPKYIVQACVSETLGSFFLSFLYLTQTEEKTKLSKDPGIVTFIIASCYVASIIMVAPPQNKMACLNPAIGVVTTLVMAFFGDSSGIKYIWLYGLFPFAGGILAVVFHELVYKKIQVALEEVEEGFEGGDHDLLIERRRTSIMDRRDSNASR